VIAPGTARPGGRTARTAAAVYAATIAELSEHCYADISVETIAARAGVHKTTVYRRWGSKAELIAEALIGAADSHIQVPDTGSVDVDLRLLARAVQAVLSLPEGAAITRALIVGAMTSPELARLMERFWATRLEAISVIVDRAIRAGQLPAGTDAAALMHAMAAPLYYQLLVTGGPVTESDADLSAAAALTAAAARLFVVPSPTALPKVSKSRCS
jgi:AcrR family transcriptional regulator